MNVIFNKADLIEALKDFDNNDQIVIEVHDMTIHEDLYQFNIDHIHMGLDKDGNDRGYEIRLCVIPNK